MFFRRVRTASADQHQHLARVAATLLSSPVPLAQLEVVDLCGLPPGPVAVALTGLTQRGWAECHWYAPSTGPGPGRARYTLTDEGHARIPALLDRVQHGPLPRRWKFYWKRGT